MRDFRQDKAHRWIRDEPSTIVLQPTTACPLNCKYCYLPKRHLKQEMSPDVTMAIVRSLPSGLVSETGLDVVWHGGEPLAIGPAGFVALIEPFEPLRAEERVRHLVQTNATLITDEWCDLFRRYNVSVGVSIDGPRFVNRNRVNWARKPMFDQIMTGIDTLKRNGLSFTALAVIGLDGLEAPCEILDFLTDLGCQWVGLNIEAKESANRHGVTPTFEEARRFWREVVVWAHRNPGMRIRDIESLLAYLAMGPAAREIDARCDLIPTVSRSGDVVLLSPELLDVGDRSYDDFVVGNVLTESLSNILGRAAGLTYVQEFAQGLEACKASCDFFQYCQGAHAGNRYFEHGTFVATETQHCRTSFQAPVLGLLDVVKENGVLSSGPLHRLAMANDTLLNELLERHRVAQAVDGIVPTRAADWGRKGNTHFKDNKWFKNK